MFPCTLGPVHNKAPAPPLAESAHTSIPITVHAIITNAIRNGTCSLSGATSNIGANTGRNTKSPTKLTVSTRAPSGSAFPRSTNFGPITAPRMILTAYPPQYAWIPIQIHAVMMKFRNGQKPPRMPHAPRERTVKPM